MRAISDTFINNFLKLDGILNPILTQVRSDHTLMLAIRDNYINVYFRGGNILKLSEHKKGFYQTYFDKNYNILGRDIPQLPSKIENQEDANVWVASFPILKTFMDEYFSLHNKPEREFQQLVARENNNSSISTESEYFISDIEVNDKETGARFDMMAIRWLATRRKDGSRCKPALIEMKYGDGALGRNAGLKKHLKDMESLISNTENYTKLLQTMENQFNQLDQLGLLKFNKGKSNAKIELSENKKPEVIFILANHNPRSKKLRKILMDPELDKYESSQLFDLRFFVASFSGYGLHSDCMHPLAEFRNLL
jgi:hypothetical protein